MDLEGLAERLRHEMELIIETELVLGSTALSHSYFLQVENLKGLTAMGSQKPRARKRVSESCLGCFICEGKHFTRDCPLKSTAECYFRGEGWRRNGIHKSYTCAQH